MSLCCNCFAACQRLSGRLAGGFSVFAGVGERTREGNDLYKEMTESVSYHVCIVTTQLGWHYAYLSTTGIMELLLSMIAGCHQAG